MLSCPSPEAREGDAWAWQHSVVTFFSAATERRQSGISWNICVACTTLHACINLFHPTQTLLPRFQFRSRATLPLRSCTKGRSSCLTEDHATSSTCMNILSRLTKSSLQSPSNAISISRPLTAHLLTMSGCNESVFQ